MRRHDSAIEAIGWPLGVLAVVAGVVAGLAWSAFGGAHRVAADPAGADAVLAAMAPVPVALPPVAAKLPPRSTRAAAVATPPAVPAAAPDSSLDRAEVCGYGTVLRAPDDPDLLQRLPAATRRAAVDAADARMLSSGDEQVRAAALLIGARSRHDPAARIGRLARLAVSSQDTTVYAIALEACSGGPVAECALLSRAQWVRLDPDNAQPWLALAAEARARHDGDGEAEAMRHAASAVRSEAPAVLLPSLVDRALGDDAPALQRTLALSLAWSVQAAWRTSQVEQAGAWCSDDVPARRDDCEAMSRVLAERGTSAAELGIGLSIARRLGVPLARLAALQQEQDAISEAGAFTEVGVDWSCAAVERLQRSVRRLAAGGERQAMRDTLARSGRSLADWSAEHRRNVALAATVAGAATEATAATEPAAPR